MVAQATQQSGGRRRSFRLRPIGYVRTPYRYPEETPTQAPLNPDEQGLLVVYPRYVPALTGLAEFEYVQLITLLDRVPEQLPEGPDQLVQVPFMLQDTGEAVGVFASRFPVRPNRLGLSLVRVERARSSEHRPGTRRLLPTLRLRSGCWSRRPRRTRSARGWSTRPRC